MKQYLDVLKLVRQEGVLLPNRTSTSAYMIFDPSQTTMAFDLRNGFPAVTTKKLAWRPMLAELLFFIAGDSDNRNLNKLGCHIWDINASDPKWLPKAKFEGDLGRIYGVQWRNWQAPDGKTVDQLANAIKEITANPTSRRIIVNAWNAGELDLMTLTPCHAAFQFNVNGEKLDTLDVWMYQRSADMFLGVPFNIASYALLLHLVAQITGLKPGKFIHTLTNAHIYEDHLEQVDIQLSRRPYPLPQLWIDPSLKSLDDIVNRYREILKQVDAGAKPGELLDGVAHLVNYQFHESLTGKMAN